MPEFPFIRQLDSNDCGLACLRMVAKFHRREVTLAKIRELIQARRSGVSIDDLLFAGGQIGFRTRAVSADLGSIEQLQTPWIAHWQGKHFGVVYKVTDDTVHVADPAAGRIRYSREDFAEGWLNANGRGSAVLLEPVGANGETVRSERPGGTSLRLLLDYVQPYKKQFVQLLIGMLIGSFLLLAVPFLTRAIVDVGIAGRDMRFIYSLLIAQLMIFAGRTTLDFLRSRMLMHIGARINIEIISEFLSKLMRLPLTFFDARMMGDIIQRIADLQRLQSFLTASAVNTLFSILNLVVFGVALLVFSPKIFAIFLVGAAASAGWLLTFTPKRRAIDYRKFDQMSHTQNHLVQVVQGMTEIKLNGADELKRGEWEQLQSRLFRLELDSLRVNQTQIGGSLALNELRSILISVIAATEVVQGHITLGMMMAITYLAGQLSSPIESLLTFMQSAQDAKLSLERVADIHNMADERPGEHAPPARPADIEARGLTFSYGTRSEPAVDDLSLSIPAGKITAIVGASGSGKTTLVKMMLKMIEPSSGELRVGPHDLKDIDSRAWRARCGAVMQDGFIFADSLARNIAVGDPDPDEQRIWTAVGMAGLDSFVRSLPAGLETKLGFNGNGLSQGQKQRLLIARAVYKNPDYLFFDEATSSLDATTERVVMLNLHQFFRDRTVVFVAHRLSTVRNADQIIVLNKGRIVEQGTHAELVDLGAAYYELVRNQLELGS